MTGGFGPSLSAAPADARWSGTARVVGPRWAHLPTLTIGLLGVQIFWSVEMSYASPYLLSLGLTTSHVALVFLAGPLSGLLVQPLVGAYADTNTSRWGRRRPYILGGCVLCVGGMLLLGYTREVAGWVLEMGGHAHGVLTVWLAVLAIFVIDFSINAVQAVDRALLVDTLPPAQQAAGNACAALMLGGGSVVGFFIGNLPLRTLLPFLRADSELQALSVLVSALLLGCHAFTAALVKERVLLGGVGTAPSLRHELREIYTHARALPRVIRQICFIQFFAWLGWFPVLFYTTMYITDVYLQDQDANAARLSSALAGSSIPEIANGTTAYPPAVRLLAAMARAASAATNKNSTTTPAARYHPAVQLLARASPLNSTIPSTDGAGQGGGADADADAPTRLGARAQLLSALLALAANALLPFVIPDARAGGVDKRDRRALRNSQIVGRVDLESVGLGLSPVDAGVGRSLAYGVGKDERGWWRRIGRRMRVPDAVRVPLPTMWAASHLVFAGCMVGSFFTHSVAGATFLVACTGFSWGVTQWAPFSLLAEAILTAPASTPGRGSVAIRLADTRTGIRAGEVNEEEEGFLVSRPGEESDSEDEGERGGLGKAKAVRGSDDGSESDGDIEFVRPDEDGVYPPKRPIGHRRGNSALLLGNPAAQLSVVDVLTPREAWGEDEDRGGGGGMREARDAELGVGAGRGRGRGGDGDGEGREREEEGGALSSKAGVILGIHNIFIVIPQFLVTGLSAAIFAIFDGEAAPPGHAPAPEGEGVSRRNSVVYVFRIGGIWASIAFVLAWRLARELRRR